eukprot:2825423-Rhodomonas_salina.1
MARLVPHPHLTTQGLYLIRRGLVQHYAGLLWPYAQGWYHPTRGVGMVLRVGEAIVVGGVLGAGCPCRLNRCRKGRGGRGHGGLEERGGG